MRQEQILQPKAHTLEQLEICLCLYVKTPQAF